MLRISLSKVCSLLISVGLLLSVVIAAPSPRAQAASGRVLTFLYSISGQKTVSGQHNREPNSNPTMWTDAIQRTTGHFPGLWSGDFLFQQDNIDNRWTMINEAKNQWDHGSLVNIMFHACPPTQSEPCNWEGGVLSHLSDAQWAELITDGTPLNNVWKGRLDTISPYLQFLEDNGVEVLWRPIHEMNQRAFWWGGRTGPNGTRKLYELTHDYLTNVKGLTNLIWIWDVQDLSRNFIDYRPDDKFWDVAALDVYNGDGFTQSKYNDILAVAGTKPIAIGESARLPTPAQLAAQPRWTFFMPWAELVYEANTVEEIQTLYNDPRVLTQDEMPGWGTLLPSPSPFGPPIWYNIINKNSGKCIEANGNMVQQATCNSSTAQQWKFQLTRSGYFRVENRANPGQVFTVSGMPRADHSMIELGPYTGGDNQQWAPATEGNGFYHFIGSRSGKKCLSVPGASMADGVQLEQLTCNDSAAQSFSLQARP